MPRVTCESAKCMRRVIETSPITLLCLTIAASPDNHLTIYNYTRVVR